MVPIPALLATSGVHHHLIREETPHALRPDHRNGRSPRGASFRLADRLRRRRGQSVPGLRHARPDARRRLHSPNSVHATRSCEKNYVKAVGKGLLKVMSKMGISTQQSYRGAQIFEAIGLNQPLRRRILHLDRQPHRRRRASRPSPRNRCAGTNTPTRAPTCRKRSISTSAGSINGAARAKRTCFSPDVVAKLQQATQLNSREEFRKFCQLIDQQQRQLLTLRGLLEFKPAEHADSARGSRAGRGDRQAVRHRRHVVRLDLERSARDAGHRHESHRRQEQHRRRGRRPGPLSSPTPTATAAPAPSSKWPAAASA